MQPGSRTAAMDYERFLGLVDQWSGDGRDAAEQATRATLQTLAERLSEGEARQLARQRPPEVMGWLYKLGGPEPLAIDEFLRRALLPRP